MSGDRGCYAFHELIRAYAAELSDSTDTDTDRHEALARILDHYQHSSYAAQVELRPHREPTAPSPPPPGVTPEQFSDYASAISCSPPRAMCSTRQSRWPRDQILRFPAWQLALTMQQSYQWWHSGRSVATMHQSYCLDHIVNDTRSS
jgi:hypothetical protein